MARDVLLDSIRIENFKAFRDTGVVPLKPITLLVGKNSAGKSSLIKAILACMQHSQSSSPPDQSDFPLIGNQTNLGTFEETIHANNTDKIFSFSFGLPSPIPTPIFKPEEDLDFNNEIYTIRYSYGRNHISPIGVKLVGVEATAKGKTLIKSTGFNQHTNARGRLKGITWNKKQIFSDGDSFDESMLRYTNFSLQEDEVLDVNDLKVRVFLDTSGFGLHTRMHYVGTNIQRSMFNRFGIGFNPNNAIGNFESSTLACESLLSRARYIGPLREEPTRESRLAQSSGNRIGTRGEDLSSMLHIRRDNEEFMDKFNKNLQMFGIADTATTAASYMKVKKGVKEEEIETGYIQILIEKDGTFRSLMDLGFGTSQVLPIIFQLSLRRNRLLILEQPELHLHPAAQLEIGNLLKFAIEQGNQIIAETHSANMIERLRSLIRSGELTKDDVNIVYISKDSDGSSRCDIIGFNDDGTFDDTWPEDDFFGEREQEIFSNW